MTGQLEIETTANSSIPDAQVVTSGVSSRIRRGATKEDFRWLAYQSDGMSVRYVWTRQQEDAIELKSNDETALKACFDLIEREDLQVL